MTLDFGGKKGSFVKVSSCRLLTHIWWNLGSVCWFLPIFYRRASTARACQQEQQEK